MFRREKIIKFSNSFLDLIVALRSMIIPVLNVTENFLQSKTRFHLQKTMSVKDMNI